MFKILQLLLHHQSINIVDLNIYDEGSHEYLTTPLLKWTFCSFSSVFQKNTLTLIGMTLKKSLTKVRIHL